jgi:anti-sigma regulatory factor (Ser/Thr protein kinase)
MGRPEHQAPLVRCDISDERSVSQARRVVAELLRDRDDLITDDVLLATSELVTNVVRHTRDGGVLRVWDQGSDAPLRVEVEDTDPTIPVIPAEPHDNGGRGLAIVQAVTRGWGVDPLPAGKIVWAEFDRNHRPDNTAPRLAE